MQQSLFLFLLFASTWWPVPNLAQSPALPYSGLRVALFDVKILNIRGKTVSLKCRMANTGRESVGGNKNTGETLVELDTINLPPRLWGHESELADAARNEIPRLGTGEISGPIWLKVTVRPPPAPTDGECPDLAIDTAYIYRYSDNEITIRYVLANIGNAAVEVASSVFNLGINLYFIGGNKLTRGAVPAGNTKVLQGSETLTGWLKAGQRLRGEIVIDLKNRTKFAPNILIELAPPPNLRECDRTNNTRAVAVKY